MRSKRDLKIYNKTKKYLEKKNDLDIESKMKIIDSILDIEDSNKRLDYLYDLICDYLDNEFRSKNICEFNCGICKKRQAMINEGIKKDTYLNGCCYSYVHEKNCIYLENGMCKTKNLGCKLFTCDYLKREGYKYKLKDIYLSKYFFNFRQKLFIENAIKKSKEEVIKGIKKRGRI